MVEAVAIPVGLFAFAWTSAPSVHWAVSIVLFSSFGFGIVPVFYVLLFYLIDSYTIYTASVLAATEMLRALVGTASSLSTTQMFHNLGIQWATSIPAFLAVICMPFPFVLYRYGAIVRSKCKYAQEAAEISTQMETQLVNNDVLTRTNAAEKLQTV